MLAAIRSRVARDPGLAWLVAALVLAALLYAPSVPRGLTNYDDPWLYANNAIVQHASWASVHAIFFELDANHRFTLGAEYLPVRDLSVMLDFALFGDWYPGFHAVGLALYLAAIALWFQALAALGVDRRIAGLAMLIWAIHPSHAESVAWLAERKGVLAAAFAGAAVLGYARFRAGRSARWLILGALAAACAVWSKAPAAFAIAALAPLEVALPGRASWRRSLVGLATIGAVTAAAFAPVLIVAASATVVGGAPGEPVSRAALVAGVHGFYLQLAAMLPRDAIVYPITSHGPTWFEIALGGVSLAVVLAIAVVPRRIHPAVRAGAWLWLLGWLPVSHAILPLQHVAADRYLLLPTLGFALALAALLDALPASRMRAALIAAIAIAASLRTYDAQAGWRDARSLWGRAVESDPDDAHAWSEYAEAVADSGDLAGALAATAEGLRVAPSPVLQLREALLLRASGDAAGSLAAMRVAAEAGEPKAMSNLALLELDAGHADDALAWARRGALASPIRAQAHRTLGKVLLATHRPDDAVAALAAFRRAYALEPLVLANRYNLALALIATGRPGEARAHLEACLADASLAAAARRELAALPESD